MAEPEFFRERSCISIWIIQTYGSIKRGKTSKVGIIGATKGYGYTLLAQIPKVKNMKLRVICSRHTDECQEVLREVGYTDSQIFVCKNKEEIDQAPPKPFSLSAITAW